MTAVFAICDYAVQLAERRRAEPREDAMSKIAAAADTEQLSADELMGMTLLLAGAGNETTGNWLSWTAKQLADHPDQRKSQGRLFFD